MDNEHQDFIEYWGEARRVGLLKFMALHGITWGIVVCLVVRTLGLTEFSVANLYFSGSFLIDLVVYIIAGMIGVGFLSWQVNERFYQRFLKESQWE